MKQEQPLPNMSNPNEQVTEAVDRAIDILSRIKDSIVSMQRDATAGNATWPQAGTMNKVLDMLTEVETFVWQKPMFSIIKPVEAPKPVIGPENRKQIEKVAEDRDTTIAEIKDRLRERTGITWSVRGGKGTSWGWIKIQSVPSRMKDALMTDEDREALRVALGLEQVHSQGISIPASSGYRREYVARARYGDACGYKGEPYWD